MLFKVFIGDINEVQEFKAFISAVNFISTAKSHAC